MGQLGGGHHLAGEQDRGPVRVVEDEAGDYHYENAKKEAPIFKLLPVVVPVEARLVVRNPQAVLQHHYGIGSILNSGYHAGPNFLEGDGVQDISNMIEG